MGVPATPVSLEINLRSAFLLTAAYHEQGHVPRNKRMKLRVRTRSPVDPGADPRYTGQGLKRIVAQRLGESALANGCSGVLLGNDVAAVFKTSDGNF